MACAFRRETGPQSAAGCASPPSSGEEIRPYARFDRGSKERSDDQGA